MAEERPCRFCHIYASGEDVIYQNPFFFAILDRYPVTPGHAEVIPKRHVESLLELTADEWSFLRFGINDLVAQLRSTDLRKAYEEFQRNPLEPISTLYIQEVLDGSFLGKTPDAYNHGVNDGLAAGRTVHHLHWHIIPRYTGDMVDPCGGVRHVIPERGNYRLSALQEGMSLSSRVLDP